MCSATTPPARRTIRCERTRTKTSASQAAWAPGPSFACWPPSLSLARRVSCHNFFSFPFSPFSLCSFTSKLWARKKKRPFPPAFGEKLASAGGRAEAFERLLSLLAFPYNAPLLSADAKVQN